MIRTIQTQCGDLSFSISVSAFVLVGMLQFHTRWFQSVFWGALLITSLRHAYVHTQNEQASQVKIVSIDPTYALVNEPLSIAVDGQNLHDQAWISWVPYWKCADTRFSNEQQQQPPPQPPQPQACHHALQSSPSRLNAGMVVVELNHIDEYIPCYNSDEPLNFQCFDQVRLRVRDKTSMPGWSFGTRTRTAIKQDLHDQEKNDDDMMK